jgi:hypothetical protein
MLSTICQSYRASRVVTMTASMNLITAQISFLVRCALPAYDLSILSGDLLSTLQVTMFTAAGTLPICHPFQAMSLTCCLIFQEGRFALIHIPLHYYPFFLQPIQRLLFGEDHGEDANGTPWPYRHGFLNVSITPAECSLVCSRELADRFFEPLVDRFNGLQQSGEGTDHVQISPEDFNVIQVDGQGLDAGQRVLELTSPLALAGM